MRCNRLCFAVLVVACALLCSSSRRAAAAGACGKTPSSSTDWIDGSTGADACTKTVCRRTGPYASCWPQQRAVEDMVLVFTDEFNTAAGSRSFSTSPSADMRWTAVDLHYSSDQKEDQNYHPQQISMQEGALNITFKREMNNRAAWHWREGDSVVAKNYSSGMLQSWNKFCLTGGYVEFAVQLPGNAEDSGLWAATWLQGNLGRAGYYKGLTGMWPYSYNECEGSGKLPWLSAPGQRISACSNAKGRGAPEIDVLEYGNFGNGPSYVHTLQMAPVAPPFSSWMVNTTAVTGVSEVLGVHLPGRSNPQAQTELPTDAGQLSRQGFPRPGTDLTDTFKGSSRLGPQHFAGFHRYAVLWEPGQFVSWFLDDELLFEVNSEALRPMVNADGQSIGQRLIPTEAAYIVMNLAMSNESWARVSPNLELPASMLVDYVRVWQRRGAVNVGRDPPDMPTRDWISCHASDYGIHSPIEVAIWSLQGCSDSVRKINILLMAFAGFIVTAVAGAVAALSAMSSRMQRNQGPFSRLSPEEHHAAITSGTKTEVLCYLRSSSEQLRHHLAAARPDLLAAVGRDAPAG